MDTTTRINRKLFDETFHREPRLTCGVVHADVYMSRAQFSVDFVYAQLYRLAQSQGVPRMAANHRLHFIMDPASIDEKFLQEFSEAVHSLGYSFTSAALTRLGIGHFVGKQRYASHHAIIDYHDLTVTGR